MIAIATQQPMASDLRILAAILDIATELERIGDYAKGIARINLMIGKDPLIKPLIDIPRMAKQARHAPPGPGGLCPAGRGDGQASFPTRTMWSTSYTTRSTVS